MIISPYDVIVIYNHTARTANPFWPKNQQKDGNRSFHPSAKSHTELKLGSSEVVFRGRRANNAQNFIAPPKRLVLDLMPEKFEKRLHFFLSGVEK